MSKVRNIAASAALMMPGAIMAHPHVFVETQLTLVFEGTTPVGVQVDWVYDEFFSLLLTSDLGIDLDGDMDLTAAEEAILDQAVTQWPEGFMGDLEVLQNGTEVALGAKVAHAMSFADGIVTETHVRVLPPMTDAPISLRAYDPFYFIAYDLTLPVLVSGRDDCAVSLVPADIDAAREMVAELTGGQAPEDVGPDEDFPQVGSAFADTVTVTCG